MYELKLVPSIPRKENSLQPMNPLGLALSADRRGKGCNGSFTARGIE
jgi:hypothetical protein